MTSQTIHLVGILGAGQMGAGIAQVAVQAGYRVRLGDVSLEVAQRGKIKVGGGLAKLVDKGKLGADEAEQLAQRITPVGDASQFAECDIIIEAAAENFELKAKLLGHLSSISRPDAILASNTSSISLTRLAAATSRPAQVVGLHFFNPAPLMKLLELVRATQTSDETTARTKAFAESLGKTVILSNDAPGFIVNRMLIPLLNEACFALQEHVATAEAIDAGAKLGLNHPMGPLELADLIGLDTVLSIADVLARDFGDPKYRAPTLLRNLVAAGWLGKKTGRGFYTYDTPGAKKAAGGAA